MSDAALLESPPVVASASGSSHAGDVRELEDEPAPEPLKSPPPGDPATLPAGLFHWRFSVEQYHRMLDAGVLRSGDRVELLEGWLIAKMPTNPPHRLANKLAYDVLFRLVPAGWYVDQQSSLTTTDSEPEPDVSIVRGQPRGYATRHPGPADTALVVEVSDSTLSKDQSLKKRLYAGAAVPLYWILNLPKRQLEVYSEPSGLAVAPADYGRRRIYCDGQSVALVLDGQEIATVAVADLLP